MTDLHSKEATSSLRLATPPPLTLHPAAVYLSGLGEGSKSSMQQYLSGDRISNYVGSRC
ncbi:MAG TPA: hypothetical protein V6D12_10415 [Candidatus Obscuribacterales bacterium]